MIIKKEKYLSTTHQQFVNNSVYKRWKQQYPEQKAEITKALKELNNPTKEEIDSIIGNTSWTRIICGVCDKEVSEAALLGENIMYEQAPVAVCKECLNEAVYLLSVVYEA